MNEDTYRDKLNDLQLEVEALRAKLKEAQTGDLISRQAAIDALAKFVPYAICDESTESYTNGLTDAYNLICQLPSTQPERWIPCSERLPEGIGQVIIQTNGDAIHEVFYKGKNDYGHEVWMRLDGGIYWDDEVIAWMPLPEPYVERRTDESNV